MIRNGRINKNEKKKLSLKLFKFLRLRNLMDAKFARSQFFEKKKFQIVFQLLESKAGNADGAVKTRTKIGLGRAHAFTT
jgi:hypothetical protein